MQKNCLSVNLSSCNFQSCLSFFLFLFPFATPPPPSPPPFLVFNDSGQRVHQSSNPSPELFIIFQLGFPPHYLPHSCSLFRFSSVFLLLSLPSSPLIFFSFFPSSFTFSPLGFCVNPSMSDGYGSQSGYDLKSRVHNSSLIRLSSLKNVIT
jgi:hypothetical protein